MGGFLANLALHLIPCALLGWLSAEAYLRNSRHTLNRLASIMFAFMMLQFGTSFLASVFPEEHAAKLINMFVIVPSFVLGFLVMLFMRQLSGQTAKQSAPYLDLALAIPWILVVLVISQPDLYGVYADGAGIVQRGSRSLPVSLVISATTWLYCMAVWVFGWGVVRSAPSSARSQLAQAGFGVFGGAVTAFSAMLLASRDAEAAAMPLLLLYAMLLFAFFIRRAMMLYGLMPSLMEKYRVLFELSPFGVVLLDANGQIRDANPVIKLLLGLPSAELIGKPLAMFLEQGERLPLGGSGSALVEVSMVAVTGESRRMIVHLNELTADGERQYYVVLQDVTGRKKAEEEILYLAYHDALTGVGNRLYFQDSISSMLKNGSVGALLLLDLDRFKSINDLHGHQAGDALLCEIAENMRDSTPAGALLFRLGGDEFAILLPAGGRGWDPERTAAELLAGLTGHRGAILPDSPVTVSIGIAYWPDHGGDTTTLLHAADTAMYRAKEQGRNRYSVFDAPSCRMSGA